MKQRKDRPDVGCRVSANVYGYFGPLTGEVKWTGATQGQMMLENGVMVFFVYKDGWSYA